jgi:hypothetical protein
VEVWLVHATLHLASAIGLFSNFCRYYGKAVEHPNRNLIFSNMGYQKAGFTNTSSAIMRFCSREDCKENRDSCNIHLFVE